MKRSKSIQLTLVTSVAATLLGCREKSTRYCVDEYQTVVANTNCETPFPNRYHWAYYAASRGFHGGYIPLGTHMTGGSFVAPSGGFTTGSTTHGVIGAAGEHASGGHGGGGE